MTAKTQPTNAVAKPATDRDTHFYLAGWNGARGNEDSHEHFRQALQAAPPAPAAVAVPELRLTDEQIEQAFISARDEFMLREIGRTDKKLRLAFGRAVLKAALAAAPAQEHATQLASQRQEKCVCTFAQRVVGDGCRHCNPEEYIDRLHKCLDEYREEADTPPQAQVATHDGLTKAVRDVLAERARQVERKGYDPEHDDSHVLGEIGALAALYLMPDGARSWDASSTGYGDTLSEALLPSGWSLPAMGGDCRADAVKGVACGLAEIERLDRDAARAAQGGAA